MKKVLSVMLSVLCAAAMIVSVVAIASTESEGAYLSIAFEKDSSAITEIEKDGTFTANVLINDNEYLAGVEVSFEFDNSAFEVQQISSPLLPTATLSQIGIANSKGRVKIAYVSTENVTGSGTLLSMTFKAKDDAVLGDYDFDAKAIEDSQFYYGGERLQDEIDFDLEDATESLKVVGVAQDITVTKKENAVYGEEFDVEATVNDGLDAFTYEIDDTDVATVDANGHVTVKDTGSFKLTVKQAGNYKYSPFEDTQTITVSAKTLSIASLDAYAKTATLDGVVTGDTVSVDFDKASRIIGDAYDSSNTKVKVTGLELKGTDAEKYTLSSSEYDAFVANSNIAVVTVSSDHADVTGGGKYFVGDSVTVTAEPASEYTFTAWNNGASNVSTDATYVFTASANVNLTAVCTSTSSKPGAQTVTTVVSANGDYSHFKITVNGANYANATAIITLRDADGKIVSHKCAAISDKDSTSKVAEYDVKTNGATTYTVDYVSSIASMFSVYNTASGTL